MFDPVDVKQNLCVRQVAVKQDKARTKLVGKL